ncbi:unnamed protein product [Calicophoron daubneyi]|uniref:NADPH--cytochrome P450 reductase n=1 Tax=Calicophoron daubneyi TaxID=300641 RepID=A0AAV2T3Y9_CALDB
MESTKEAHSYFTPVDFLFALMAALLALIYWISHIASRSKGENSGNSTLKCYRDGAFFDLMLQHRIHVAIFYGSQTGTAETYALNLNKFLSNQSIRCLAFNISSCDMTTFSRFAHIPYSVAVFLLATFGDGEPTDSARAFVDWLQRTPDRFEGVNYAIFGFGNSSYPNFNTCAKSVDRMLRRHGASRFHPTQLGDELNSLEADFLDWQSSLLVSLQEYLHLDPNADRCIQSQSIYKLRLLDQRGIKSSTLFTGEPSVLGSYRNQVAPFNSENPFMARILVNRELDMSGKRSCRHIELDITGSHFRFQPGDYVAVLPSNPDDLVERLGSLLALDLDQPITLEAVDPLTPRRHPFPCPCTYRTAFTHYLSITGPPRMNLFSKASLYATDKLEAEQLRLLGSNTSEGKLYYKQYVLDEYRNIVDILGEFRSLRLPNELLLQSLDRLKPRFYSISSSLLAHPNRIHITARLVEHLTKSGRNFTGLTTNWLNSRDPLVASHALVPVYVQPSCFHLPRSPKIPVIMIGAGTGLAPFRAFIQQRWAQLKDKGAISLFSLTVCSPPLHRVEISGNKQSLMWLFFGCRRRLEDYLYADELEMARNLGAVNLFVAFSRESNQKVYVQDLMREVSSDICALLENMHAHVYVCGSARTIGKAVHKCLVEIIAYRYKISTADAEKHLNSLRLAGRYHTDVWN